MLPGPRHGGLTTMWTLFTIPLDGNIEGNMGLMILRVGPTLEERLLSDKVPTSALDSSEKPCAVNRCCYPHNRNGGPSWWFGA